MVLMEFGMGRQIRTDVFAWVSYFTIISCFSSMCLTCLRKRTSTAYDHTHKQATQRTRQARQAQQLTLALLLNHAHKTLYLARYIFYAI